MNHQDKQPSRRSATRRTQPSHSPPPLRRPRFPANPFCAPLPHPPSPLLPPPLPFYKLSCLPPTYTSSHSYRTTPKVRHSPRQPICTQTPACFSSLRSPSNRSGPNLCDAHFSYTVSAGRWLQRRSKNCSAASGRLRRAKSWSTVSPDSADALDSFASRP